MAVQRPVPSVRRMDLPDRTITAGAALTPLRLFLGATFVYAGYQKLSDPGFLHPGSPTYIGAQLHAFASGTPGGFLLRTFALPAPTLAGVGVAITEIAIGLLTFAGLLTRGAAAAGLALNLVLFLTASWNTSPYFLGSDIVFVFAWLPFVLAGAQGQPALDHRLRRTAAGERMRGRPVRVYGDRRAGETATRSELLRRALTATGLGTLAVAGAATLMRNGYRQPAVGLAAERGTLRHRRAGHRHSAHSHPSAQAAGATPSLPQGAVKLGPASGVGAGQAATYPDPSDGSPDIVIRQQSGELTALSAVCTHAGCQVGYEGGVLVCPCHGSQFSASTGAVIQGPAVSPLPQKHVLERAGEIYALPA
jgi:thiosulfate dehydrogenase (quinone) large subunit